MWANKNARTRADKSGNIFIKVRCRGTSCRGTNGIPLLAEECQARLFGTIALLMSIYVG